MDRFHFLFSILIGLMTSFSSGWAAIEIQEKASYISHRQETQSQIKSDLQQKKYKNYRELLNSLVAEGYTIDTHFENIQPHAHQSSIISEQREDSFKLQAFTGAQLEIATYVTVLCPNELTHAYLQSTLPGGEELEISHAASTADLKIATENAIRSLNAALENGDEIIEARMNACIEVAGSEVSSVQNDVKVVWLSNYMLHSYNEHHSLAPDIRLNFRWEMGGKLNTDVIDNGVEERNFTRDFKTLQEADK